MQKIAAFIVKKRRLLLVVLQALTELLLHFFERLAAADLFGKYVVQLVGGFFADLNDVAAELGWAIHCS